MSETPADRPKLRRARQWAFWGAGSLLGLLLVATLAVAMLIGRQIAAPDWVRAGIAERINAQIEGAAVTFGGVSLMVPGNGVPRVMLRDVAILTGRGDRLATLSEMDGTLALQALVRGQVQPRSLRLSGATIHLRRTQDGKLGLAIGENRDPIKEAQGFTDLLDQLDNIVLRPELRHLRRVEADNLTIRYEDARARQAWTADGGRLTMTRDGMDLRIRGDFAVLGNRGFATTLEMNYEGRIGDTQAEFGVSFADMPARDIARQSPALAWLEALQAPISGALRAQVEGDGALGPLNVALQIGAGVLQPTEATRPIPFSGAQAYFTYDPVVQRLRFDDVSLDSKWVKARAEGTAYLVGMEQGLPRELWLQIRLTQMSANPAALYPAPVEIESATMDARLTLDPFTLTLGEMSLLDEGARLVLNGSLAARDDGWALALDGRMGALSPARLIALWPESVKTPTRNWIRDNVVEADLSNLQLVIRALPETRPALYLGFDFAGLKTRFMKAMPLIEAASGQGSLYDDRFVLTAQSGHVTAPQGGRADITGTSFVVPSVALKEAPARVYLHAKSTVTAALSLLDHDPFNFLTKAGQPVTLADGRAEIAGQLDFLLKEKVETEDVAFDIAALARAVRSDVLVKGRVLAAPEVRVTARNGVLEISGEGRIGAVPASATWRTDIGPRSDGSSTLTGMVEISERFVDEFGIGLPPGSITGAGQGAFEIDLAKGRVGVFRLSSTLEGLGLKLEPLGWALARAERGALEVTGTLGAPPEIKRVALAGGGLSAEGAVTLKPDGQLDRALFSRVQVGTWLDAPVELIGRGAGLAPAVRVTGGMIDLRQTSLAGDGERPTGRAEAGPVTLALDRLQISNGIALTEFRGELDMRRGADGSFTGKVNGIAPITGKVVPQDGRSAFRIRADDAGAVLKSGGLLKNARDGQMDLVLRPGAAKGSYDGWLMVTQIRLKDAPALAALLNALSVVGILEQLAGDGIHFGEVEAEFQLTPDRVTLTRGSAVGASMGISMEGYYFMERAEMDMQGVFSPIYMVNAVGGFLTRKGEGLIGFNYSLNGPVDAPRVRVNPLSLFTPGMFREIFREPPPEVQR